MGLVELLHIYVPGDWAKVLLYSHGVTFSGICTGSWCVFDGYFFTFDFSYLWGEVFHGDGSAEEFHLSCTAVILFQRYAEASETLEDSCEIWLDFVFCVRRNADVV